MIEMLPLIIGMLFMYQWIIGSLGRGGLFLRKQDKNHHCMNMDIEGMYECPYCYPDDYAEGMIKRGV